MNELGVAIARWYREVLTRIRHPRDHDPYGF
jgi:hypothetical protein